MKILTIIDAFYKSAERLTGGLADKKKPVEFDQTQLQQGIAVELAHTGDRAIAEELAMDNLMRDTNYYKKLPMELKKVPK